MTPTQVLAHLQGHFPDRLVLYAEDLAQVLGKSRKAVSHLLTQNGLPFKVKHLGPERCVDIFQGVQRLGASLMWQGLNNWSVLLCTKTGLPNAWQTCLRCRCRSFIRVGTN